MASIPFFICSKILGEAGKQEILQQLFRKLIKVQDLKKKKIVV